MPTPMSPRVRPVVVNRNADWLDDKASWVVYVIIILITWLAFCSWTDPGMAWTYTHIFHGVVTWYIFHWSKGSPIQEDQGKYDSLTFWEQIDQGIQYTNTRKFFTVVPVVLFLLAAHGTDYRRQPLGINLAVVLVLLVSKLSAMHKVRVFGINRY